MRPTDKIEHLISQTKYSADPATRKRIFDDVRAAMANKPEVDLKIIMNSTVIKVAAALIVTCAVYAKYYFVSWIWQEYIR